MIKNELFIHFVEETKQLIERREANPKHEETEVNEIILREDFMKSVETFYKFGLATINEYYKLKNQGKDVLNLIDKINLITLLI